MANLRAHLCNCLIGGHKITHRSDGGWTRDKIEWNLNGFDICLQQKREIARRITETIAEFAEVKPEVVWIKFNEMKKEDFSTRGLLHIDR